ncbi:hypothetical protein MG296_12395 [Flavobacteriaceae bacterium TK19130]|nr:hypothetical protein [Thermobacterium salinum]
MDKIIFDNVFQYVVLAFEGIAALTAILFYKNYKHTVLKYLPWLLTYVILNELFGRQVYEWFGNNIVLYNVYNIIYYLYFYFVFWNVSRRSDFRNWIVASIAVYCTASFINPFISDFRTQTQLLAYILGACILIFCIILYYIELLSSSKILNIKRELLFWISVGLLLFYVGYIPIKLTRHYFTSSVDLYVTLLNVQRILVIIMNSCFIIGFVWTRRR